MAIPLKDPITSQAFSGRRVAFSGPHPSAGRSAKGPLALWAAGVSGEESQRTFPREAISDYERVRLLLFSLGGKLCDFDVEYFFRFGQIRSDIFVVEPSVRRRTYDYSEIVCVKVNQFHEGAPLAFGMFGYAKHSGNIPHQPKKGRKSRTGY
jgi:hypothetical protein